MVARGLKKNKRKTQTGVCGHVFRHVRNVQLCRTPKICCGLAVIVGPRRCKKETQTQISVRSRDPRCMTRATLLRTENLLNIGHGWRCTMLRQNMQHPKNVWKLVGIRMRGTSNFVSNPKFVVDLSMIVAARLQQTTQKRQNVCKVVELTVGKCATVLGIQNLLKTGCDCGYVRLQPKAVDVQHGVWGRAFHDAGNIELPWASKMSSVGRGCEGARIKNRHKRTEWWDPRCQKCTALLASKLWELASIVDALAHHDQIAAYFHCQTKLRISHIVKRATAHAGCASSNFMTPYHNNCGQPWTGFHSERGCSYIKIPQSFKPSCWFLCEVLQNLEIYTTCTVEDLCTSCIIFCAFASVVATSRVMIRGRLSTYFRFQISYSFLTLQLPRPSRNSYPFYVLAAT